MKDKVTIDGVPINLLRNPDDTIPYILCAKPSEVFEYAPGFEPPWVKRRRLDVCAMCWANVYIDPVSEKHAPNAKLICLDCAMKLAAAEGKTQ